MSLNPSSPGFRYGAFPVISAVAGVLLKCATRNDQFVFFKKEDMAVGPQLMLTAALTFIIVSTDKARALVAVTAQSQQALLQKPVDTPKLLALQTEITRLSQAMMNSAWVLFGLVLLLWGTVTLVKRWGWETETELRRIRGIGIPLGMGVFSLGAVMMVVQS